ncbi:hypothetical protein MTO96_046090, partial [Rhipicephalus appendiculatus]
MISSAIGAPEEELLHHAAFARVFPFRNPAAPVHLGGDGIAIANCANLAPKVAHDGRINPDDDGMRRRISPRAHMVAAFEQSLSNMTSRLQHLTVTAEQKDSELTELRSTIEALKKQSAEAGLTKMALQSMAAVQRSMAPTNGAPPGGGGGGSTNLVRRHTFNTPKDAAAGALQDQHMSRQLSADSMSSVNSASSACSNASTRHEECSKNKHKKKKGWLRSSFSKAFSRSKKNRHGSVSDVEGHSSTPLGLVNSQLSAAGIGHFALNEHDEEDGGPELVRELRKQLREKDLVLTDIRLEALSSAHQLDNLKETLAKMRNEMLSLKQDNDRLHRLVRSQSLSASQSSLPHRNQHGHARQATQCPRNLLRT